MIESLQNNQTISTICNSRGRKKRLNLTRKVSNLYFLEIHKDI